MSKAAFFMMIIAVVYWRKFQYKSAIG